MRTACQSGGRRIGVSPRSAFLCDLSLFKSTERLSLKHPTPVQMMAERGIALAHTTILRWVQRYVPDFEKRWNQYARPVGDSWRVNET